MVRVRFAPSPTGFLHIGNLRSALYDELFARHNGGAFVLRIEDTDRTRFVPGAVESLLRTLSITGITPDEGPFLDADGQIKERGDFGPYVQSQRTDIYRKHVEELLANGHAYRCFCTAETLEAMKKAQADTGQPVMYDKRCRLLSADEVASRVATGEPNVIRLKVPETGKTEFHDAIRGDVAFENVLVDDQVLMKSDGFPTYHLANVIDDHLMKITHVIRGEEWLPSTPKHIILYRAFGWEPPVFAHVPLLLNPDHSKLSKRQGDVAVEDYLKQGYLPEAIVNFMATLGWNPTGDREIYTKQELIDAFNLEKINKGGAVFNREKLDWLNREYIKNLSPEEVMARVDWSAAKFFGVLNDPKYAGALARAVTLEKPRVAKLSELVVALEFYFDQNLAVDPAILPWKKSNREEARDRLSGMLELAERVPADSFGDPKALERDFIAYIVEKGWTNAESLWPMRVALTGRAASPSPFEVAWAIGREETVKRLKSAIVLLS